MRPKLIMRTSRRIYAATFALMLAIPATAVALTVGQNDTQSAIQAKLNRHHVSYGQPVTVTGTASPARPGQKLTLEYAAAGETHWRALASTRVRRNGHFRVAARLRRTGLVKVQGAAPAAVGARRAAHRHRGGEPGAGGHRRRQVPCGGAVGRPGRRPAGRQSAASCCRRCRAASCGSRAAPTAAGACCPRRAPAPAVASACRLSGASPGQQLRVRFRGDGLNTPVAKGRRADDRLSRADRVLVQRRRQHGVRLPRVLRRGQHEPAVRHQGDVPQRRPRGDGNRRRPWPVRRRPQLGSEPEHRRRPRVRRRRAGLLQPLSASSHRRHALPAVRRPSRYVCRAS